MLASLFLLYARVSEDMPLYGILNEFQKGHSHTAVVVKQSTQLIKSADGGRYPTNNLIGAILSAVSADC